MNPTPKQILRVQWKIAELQGWTNLRRMVARGLMGFENGDRRRWKLVPNWPTNRNASRDLLIEPTVEANSSYCKALDYFNELLDLPFDGRHHATVESLAWLLYKGWRWVPCSTCKGELYIPLQPDGEPTGCPECYKNDREGGEWEKV